MTELVWQQLHAVLHDHGGIRHLRYRLITHSHYDRCGLLLTLKSRMPWIHVSGSATILSMRSRVRRPAGRYVSSTRLRREPGSHSSISDSQSYPNCRFIPSIRTGNSTSATGCRFGPLRYRGTSLPVCLLLPAARHRFRVGRIGEFHDSTKWLPLIFHDLFSYRHSLDVVEQLGASRLALGHHGNLNGRFCPAGGAARARVSTHPGQGTRGSRQCGRRGRHLRQLRTTR